MRPEVHDKQLIERIAEQCDKIARYRNERAATRDRFVDDGDCQDLCAFAIIQIGECSNRLSEAFVDSHPEIDWGSLYGMRCMLTHDYIRIDLNVFWETVASDIPQLARFCKDVLAGWI